MGSVYFKENKKKMWKEILFSSPKCYVADWMTFPRRCLHPVTGLCPLPTVHCPGFAKGKIREVVDVAGKLKTQHISSAGKS